MLKRKRRRSREFKDSNRVISIDEARETRRRKRAMVADKKTKVQGPKNTVTERQATKKARRKTVYAIAFLIVIGIIGASVLNVLSVKSHQGKIEKEQEALLKEKAKLQQELQIVGSPEYIEQQARQQLKMIRPGELLYVLPEEDKTEATGSGIIPE